ncbi:hypothetical protein BGX24_007290 [Mortierella sp. AD032]|nr:hypothetical protein BGX24_007290 [Mortierella sp. AD032]
MSNGIAHSLPTPIGDDKNLHVMIVGAGLAGLLLAILLDKAGISYQVYERAEEVKPLGGVMSLNAGIFPALEQLGLYEELLKVSLPVMNGFNIYNGNLSLIACVKAEIAEVLVLNPNIFFLQLRYKGTVLIEAHFTPCRQTIFSIGYGRIVFSRANFYDLILSKVPREKIHLNKKVVSLKDDNDGITIRCTDGTTYQGDILVGADGAYSGVRQALYKRMDMTGTLPSSDTDELSKGFICMVSTTDPLNPSKYPGVADKSAHCNQIIGNGNNYSLATVEDATEHKFKNSEWGGDSSDPMIKEVRDFPIPLGGLLGDLIDATPRDNISRVSLEDKLFDTWHHGRTVLIGDACHKLLPSAGLGAVTSMQDAVVLANNLYEMKDLSSDSINEALDTFKEERYSRVKEQFMASRTSAKLIYGQSVKLKESVKGVECRPQVSFLPQVPNRGTGLVLPQRSSQRYLEEQKKLNSSAVANSVAAVV